ncbi:glycosyltransferase family 4 protein [Lacinutrix iliipiscaria]|uniref:Glycosyltransferase family 4 protein n=1 Tax=Lacinutrix iliipiscaria TaxID=1230532 RepID=A0ABW5WKV6_9FLAO
MKILLLYTYNKGYLSSFFFELSTKLAEKGHEVVNFSLKGAKKTFIKNDVEVCISKQGGYISNYFHIYKIIKRVKPDVVLSNFSYVNPALLFGKLFGVKKNMAWFHSLNEQMEPSKVDVFIKKQFLKLADTVIANSLLTKEELHEIYKVPELKLKDLPFWSNISELTTSDSDLISKTNFEGLKIGCPGRIVKHKNQAVVIQALGGIKEKYDFKFHLYFAGDGEERSNLEQLTENLKLTNDITFLKHISANDMIAFYKDLDVIILPSLHEAFGLVFIEAISMNTPVIVSSQFGALYFIDNEKYNTSKFTFNPESSEELQEKLLPYFNNEGLTKSELQQLYIENFDKHIIFNDFLSIINK